MKNIKKNSNELIKLLTDDPKNGKLPNSLEELKNLQN